MPQTKWISIFSSSVLQKILYINIFYNVDYFSIVIGNCLSDYWENDSWVLRYRPKNYPKVAFTELKWAETRQPIYQCSMAQLRIANSAGPLSGRQTVVDKVNSARPCFACSSHTSPGGRTFLYKFCCIVQWCVVHRAGDRVSYATPRRGNSGWTEMEILAIESGTTQDLEGSQSGHWRRLHWIRCDY